MFFEQNDPVFTASFFFLKHYYQQVNPSHCEKDHYLFINYELFIIHYLLLNLQTQAEGHTTIGLCACDLFIKAGKKRMKFSPMFVSSISDKQKRSFQLSDSLYYPWSNWQLLWSLCWKLWTVHCTSVSTPFPKTSKVWYSLISLSLPWQLCCGLDRA